MECSELLHITVPSGNLWVGVVFTRGRSSAPITPQRYVSTTDMWSAGTHAQTSKLRNLCKSTRARAPPIPYIRSCTQLRVMCSRNFSAPKSFPMPETTVSGRPHRQGHTVTAQDTGGKEVEWEGIETDCISKIRTAVTRTISARTIWCTENVLHKSRILA